MLNHAVYVVWYFSVVLLHNSLKVQCMKSVSWVMLLLYFFYSVNFETLPLTLCMIV